jgi:tight adherence protein B
MNLILLGIIIFTLTLLMIELCLYAFRIFRHPDQAIVRRRLRQRLAQDNGEGTGNLYKKNVLSEVPMVHRVLAMIPGIDRLQSMMNQGDVKYTPGFFLMLSMAVGCIGYLLCLVMTRYFAPALLMGICSALLPLLHVQYKKKKRMAKFEKQLPEALGLIARSLKAGHAFTSGMKLAAEEFADPLGPEFEETLDTINYGQSVPDALKGLARRVDCPDLNFFVVSVILQRETGGNLAEIIEGLAHLIRERFKFKGKVRVLSAEGRLSALILYLLPFCLGAFLFVFHPDVVAPLYKDPIGIIISWVMGGLMAIALLMIRRIIKVEV